jgi:predicted nucleotidyltransferase
VRLFGSRARGTARPDSDLDLLVTVPDAWLASHSRFEETDALGWKLAHHRLPIELLLFSASEVEQRRHGRVNVIAEAFRYGRRLEPGETLHGAG